MKYQKSSIVLIPVRLFVLAAVSFSSLVTASAQVLVGRWQFLEGTGTVTTDSVSSTAGNLIGGAAFGTITNPWGGSNGTINFSSNSGQYVDTNVAGSIIDATQSYSISMWVRWLTGSSDPAIPLGVSNTSTGKAEHRIAPGASLGRIEVDNTGITPSYIVSPWSFLGADTWYNLVLVHDAVGKFFHYYVDGSLIGPSATYTGTPTTTFSGEWFFNGVEGGLYNMRGHIADVQMYQGAVTSTQISSIIMAGNAIPEPSAVALTGVFVIAMLVRRLARR